jgi:hypothetical protein
LFEDLLFEDVGLVGKFVGELNVAVVTVAELHGVNRALCGVLAHAVVGD